jgi:hypothetical protein
VPGLSFTIESGAPVEFAAAPQLALRLAIANAAASETIQAVMLHCQVRIDASARRYSGQEQADLRDLFGAPERWATTVRSMLWTHASMIVPAFTDRTVVDLLLPCSYDFNLATTKLFHSLKGGEIPLTLLFSGTVFYAGGDGALQVAQIPWSKETSYRLPVVVWKQTMDLYYPNNLFLSLRKDVFDRLYRHKVRSGLPTWEETVERLLDEEAT